MTSERILIGGSPRVQIRNIQKLYSKGCASSPCARLLSLETRRAGDPPRGLRGFRSASHGIPAWSDEPASVSRASFRM
jgi:hypothetical protein